ncbi:MAG: hypothetical protein AAGB31_14095 [Bdellovibrio sp.]
MIQKFPPWLHFLAALVVLVLLNFLWYIFAESEPPLSLSREQILAIEHSQNIYKAEGRGTSYVKYLGEVQLILENENSPAFLVFRGTARTPAEFLRNIHLVPFLAMCLLSLILAAIAIQLPPASWKRKIALVIVYIVVYFLNTAPDFRIDTKYQESSDLLMQELLKDQNAESFADLLQKKNISKLYFTGHSKAGAEATLQYLKYKDTLKAMNIETHLMTIGAAPAAKQNGEDPQATQFVFVTDSAQLLNPNVYWGERILRTPPATCYFLFYVILPFVFFSASLSVVFSNTWHRPSWRKVWILGLTLPVMIIVTHLCLTHPAGKYVEYVHKHNSEARK